MSTLIHRRVKAANLGKNPTVICQMRSGWVVLGDVQFLPDPVVEDLNALVRSLVGSLYEAIPFNVYFINIFSSYLT